MGNRLFVPGAFGYAPFQKKLIDEKLGYGPDFFKGRTFLTFDDCYEEFDKLNIKGDMNPETKVCGFSAGNIAYLKYLSLKQGKVKIKRLISVAGTMGELRLSPKNLVCQFVLTRLGYTLTEENMEFVKNLIPERHGFYSNCDHFISDKSLKRFIDLLGATPHFLKNHGHFGRTSGITEISGLKELLI